MAMPHNETSRLAKTSWWFDDAIKHDPSATAAALNGTITADVAIVGGGFTGLWTALLLKEKSPDLKIALIEADLCGSGASGKNGGKVHGYWSALPGIAATLGPDAALAVAHAGLKEDMLGRDTDKIRSFCLYGNGSQWAR